MTSLERLLAAIGMGAALAGTAAGCTQTTATPPGQQLPPDSLQPYSVAGLGCSGPEYDGGYYGQCCVSVHCYTSSSSCRAAIDPELRAEVPVPPGSGTCACGGIGTASGGYGVEGPYAPNAEDPAAPAGNCCYVIGSIACTGRPLQIDGQNRVAPLVPRSDCSTWA